MPSPPPVEVDTLYESHTTLKCLPYSFDSTTLDNHDVGFLAIHPQHMDLYQMVITSDLLSTEQPTPLSHRGEPISQPSGNTRGNPRGNSEGDRLGENGIEYGNGATAAPVSHGRSEWDPRSPSRHEREPTSGNGGRALRFLATLGLSETPQVIEVVDVRKGILPYLSIAPLNNGIVETKIRRASCVSTESVNDVGVSQSGAGSLTCSLDLSSLVVTFCKDGKVREPSV